MSDFVRRWKTHLTSSSLSFNLSVFFLRNAPLIDASTRSRQKWSPVGLFLYIVLFVDFSQMTTGRKNAGYENFC